MLIMLGKISKEVKQACQFAFKQHNRSEVLILGEFSWRRIFPVVGTEYVHVPKTQGFFVVWRSVERTSRNPSAASLVCSGRGVRMLVVSCLGRKDR